MLRIAHHPDVRAFLARAEPWLLANETLHGLLLGVARQVLAGTAQFRPPLYWATVEDDASGEILGCAFRTPPHQVGVTELPEAAIEPLVASVRERYLNLPGVAGPERTATAFANEWTARFGGEWSVHHHQRLHSITSVTFPSTRANGFLRQALTPDLPVARAWVAGFIKDTGIRHTSTEAGERLIRDGRLYFWMDGEPRCMVAAMRDTPNTTGIGGVYTPPRFRNQGYATMAVATLSQRLLESGRQSCFLYTDLANPASNIVYRRIGYEPLHDVVDITIL